MKPKDTVFSKKFSINCRGHILNLECPKIMGILNLTPDSFYDGGRYTEEKAMMKQLEKMISEGADIIDLGGFSSRPGADIPSPKTEKERLKPALSYLKAKHPDVLISIDTWNANTADWAIENYLVGLINDISSGRHDPDIIDVVAKWKLPYIAMHMQGTPEDMQKNPSYEDIVDDLLFYFAERVQFLYSKGINDIIIDPGFGFGKTLDHNYTLLSLLDVFNSLELPIMVGISRKSMIYKFINTSAKESLNGTTALHMFALLKGVNILRVHDVAEAKETIQLFNKLYSAGKSE